MSKKIQKMSRSLLLLLRGNVKISLQFTLSRFTSVRCLPRQINETVIGQYGSRFLFQFTLPFQGKAGGQLCIAFLLGYKNGGI